jgi:enamine deaminase RidA (YjgF/YER057c/UK114 family)
VRQQGAGMVQAVRAGDLVLTGGATGSSVRAQLAGLIAAIAQQGMAPEALALLRVFYRQGGDEAALRAEIAATLPPGVAVAVSFVPVPHAGAADGALSIEAAAVDGADLGHVPLPDGPAPFASGLRRGRFLFLSAQVAGANLGLPGESHDLMQRLGATLAALGADFGDVVRMNRWYHAAGTKDEWEPSARATAAFYAEPGPIATAISLPRPLPEGRAIQIELMAMRGTDGAVLPKRHAWPEGLWDWPIHLPYKHGLACGGLGFVGGQVSLDGQARVIDPDRLDLQIGRSLANIDRVARDLGAVGPPLHLGVYYETPPGGLAGSAPGAAGLRALAEAAVPAVLAGFDYLSYPQMRVEIEAIVTLARPT